MVELLIDRGAEIFALVRDPNKPRYLKGLPVRILRGDLFSVPALPSNLDCVFHLAGLTKTVKSADYYTVNALGTASFFATLRQRKAHPKIVYLSSMAAAGPSDGGHGRKEDEPPAPISDYGKSKLRGENAALALRDQFQVTVIRVGAVYGPRDEDFLSYFKFARRSILLSFGLQPRLMSICYVKDLVRGLALAAQQVLPNGEIFNLGDPIPYSFEDIGRVAARLLGKHARKVAIPLWGVYLAALASDCLSIVTGRPGPVTLKKFPELVQSGWVGDLEKSFRMLGFKTSYSLEEGLRETLGWYQANGWL